ncbi:hypothetical protein BX257_1074 [Streptomyces sp. 3212.3]|jgi:hypothetical protein|nr:hypothetical protein BX257_1074 [Streptomyces sp. 3212.3]
MQNLRLPRPKRKTYFLLTLDVHRRNLNHPRITREHSMSRATDTLRVVEYWTDRDNHVIFPVARSEEVDRMTDEQLIAAYGDPEAGAVARIVR